MWRREEEKGAEQHTSQSCSLSRVGAGQATKLKSDPRPAGGSAPLPLVPFSPLEVNEL